MSILKRLKNFHHSNKQFVYPFFLFLALMNFFWCKETGYYYELIPRLLFLLVLSYLIPRLAHTGIVKKTILNDSVEPKTYLILFLILITIIHFSFPMVITWDTGHYHRYFEVISGRHTWRYWDVVRGAVFPYFLYFIHKLLGYGQQGILVSSFVFFAVLVIFIHNFYRYLPSNTSYLVYMFVAVGIIITDPTIVGYYHTLLTESYSATICIITLFLAYNMYQNQAIQKKRSVLLFSIYFTFMTPLMWHLKQPFMPLILLPLSAVLALQILQRSSRKYLLRTGAIIVLSLISLSVSIAYWNHFLPNEGHANIAKRTSEGLLSRGMIRGLKLVSVSGNLKNWANQEIDDKDMFANTELIIELIDKETKNLVNYAVIDIHDSNSKLINRDVVYLNPSYSKLGKSVKLVATVFFKYPLTVLKSYAINYLRTIHAFSYTSVDQNSIIGHRTFQNYIISNVFPQKPYRKYVSVYHQSVASYSWLAQRYYDLTDFTGVKYTIFLLLAPVILILVTLKKVVYFIIGKSEENQTMILEDIVFLFSFTVFFHIMVHIVNAATIDRYTIPVYPAMNICVLFSLFYLGSLIKQKTP